MKILLLATIATLTTLDLRVLSYEQYCLRDYQVDNRGWHHPTSPRDFRSAHQ
uniref:Uncharacterized protein n=1 Tax=Anguilla anguilla TaxID=7936 RepID=A0A0E9XIE3_ANGAN